MKCFSGLCHKHLFRATHTDVTHLFVNNIFSLRLIKKCSITNTTEYARQYLSHKSPINLESGVLNVLSVRLSVRRWQSVRMALKKLFPAMVNRSPCRLRSIASVCFLHQLWKIIYHMLSQKTNIKFSLDFVGWSGEGQKVAPDSIGGTTLEYND